MVDFLILNYNDADTTIQLVKTISEYNNIDHIVVVDNCSSDDSLDRIRAVQDNKLIVITSTRNSGYGAGNNIGIRYMAEQLHSEYILLANPDIIIDQKTIDILESFLRSHDNYAIVAPYMCNSTHNKLVNAGWAIPTTWEYILSMGLIYSKYKHPGIYKDLLSSTDKSFNVDAISGSLFLMNTAHMLMHGMFDENMFLYCEETVLGIKFKNAGLKSAILPNETYIHNHSVSISKTFKSAVKRRKLMVNSKLYVLRNYYKVSGPKYWLAQAIAKISLLETGLLSVRR